MEKATFTAQPLIHTHPFAASLSLLQSRCILFIYPDTVAQFSTEGGKLNQTLWNRYTSQPLVSSIKLSLLASHLRDAAKQM